MSWRFVKPKPLTGVTQKCSGFRGFPPPHTISLLYFEDEKESCPRLGSFIQGMYWQCHPGHEERVEGEEEGNHHAQISLESFRLKWTFSFSVLLHV